MSPKDQLEQIRLIIQPHYKGVDIVWLVQDFVTKTNRKIMDLEKEKAKLNGQLERIERDRKRISSIDEAGG
jgi:hypothetical protein